MVIRNGVLLKVEESDIDENGYVLIPADVKNVEEEAFSSLVNLKSVKFSDGVENIAFDAFYSLPNLEKVIFPSSIKSIGTSDFTCVFNSTPKIEDVELPLNVPFTKYAFGVELTLKILEKRLNAIEQILDNTKSTEEDFRFAISIYNNTINHQKFLTPKNNLLKDRFDYISFQLINLLKCKNSKGIEFGQMLIHEIFENDNIISPALLNYDTYSLYESLGLREEFRPIDFSLSLRGAVMGEDNVLTLDIKNADNLFKTKNGESAKSNNELNIFLLFVIRHEVMHLYHKTRDPKSKNIEDRKMLFITKIQKIQDGYDKGYPSRHIASHDCFPDEIDADLKAIELLAQSVIGEYGYLEFPKEIYNQKYKNRKNRAYKEIGIKNDDDLVTSVMKNALDSGRLSKNECEKLKQLIVEYENILGNNQPEQF